MRIELVRRPERSQAMALLSPLIAVALTLVAGAIIFAVDGIDPLEGLYVFFVEPLTLPWSLAGTGGQGDRRSSSSRSAWRSATCRNTWNIGAEGQLTARRDLRLAPADPLARLPELR